MTSPSHDRGLIDVSDDALLTRRVHYAERISEAQEALDAVNDEWARRRALADPHHACQSSFDSELVDEQVVLTWPCGHKATLDGPVGPRVYPEVAWKAHEWTLAHPGRTGLL